MYEDFRIDMLCELSRAGVEEDVLRKVMGVVDRVGSGYEVNRKETALVPLDRTGPGMLMEYLACRTLEGLSSMTLNNYRLALSHFIGTIRKHLWEVESNDIRGYLYQYQQQRGISNRSLDKIRNVLNSFFRWALAEGKIEKDPSAAVRPIKYVASPREALSQIELEYVRKACGDAREKAIVELLYSTGCRVSELCGLKKNDVDWDNRTAQVFGKGGKYRTVYINAKAYVALKDYLARRTDGNEHLIVSDRRPYGKLTRYAVEHIVSEISGRAFRMTGKRVTPHVFRHTTATQALSSGMPVQNISRMLGHQQIETTMVYAKINNIDVQRDHERYVV